MCSLIRLTGDPFQHVTSCGPILFHILGLPCVDADVATSPQFVLQHSVCMSNAVGNGYDMHLSSKNVQIFSDSRNLFWTVMSDRCWPSAKRRDMRRSSCSLPSPCSIWNTSPDVVFPEILRYGSVEHQHERDQFAPPWESRQLRHHSTSGNGIICADSVDGQHCRSGVQIGDGLHHVRHALAPCPCGKGALKWCRSCGRPR